MRGMRSSLFQSSRPIFFSTQPELRWNGLQGVQAASSRHARLEASVRKEADSWMSDRRRETDGLDHVDIMLFGLTWSPENFLKGAAKAKHPSVT